MDIFSKMEWKLDIDKIALFKFLKAWWERVWVTSGSWWWAGRAGMLQSVRSQRVGHDWSTELTDEKEYVDLYPSPHFRGVLQSIQLGSLGTRFGNYILLWSAESTKNQTKSTKNGMGCNWEVVRSCHCRCFKVRHLVRINSMVGLNKQSSFYFWDFMNLFWVSFL